MGVTGPVTLIRLHLVAGPTSTDSSSVGERCALIYFQQRLRQITLVLNKKWIEIEVDWKWEKYEGNGLDITASTQATN